MAYTVNTFVPNFIEAFPTDIKNGCPAYGRIVRNIAENQHWLAMTDCPMEQFISTTTANATIEFTVRVPPFAQYAEFYFFASKSTDKGTTDDIKVSAISSSLSTGNSGVDGTTSINVGSWVYFNGTYGFAADTPGTVQLLAAQAATWTDAAITVVIGSSCEVYSGFYRIIPAREYTK